MTLERVLADLVQRTDRQFFGKYRGLVVDNADPERLGRLRLRVPSVTGPEAVTGWATPCVPYGGMADQGMLFVPATGAGVWVEYEEGDLEFPIWVGTFWSKPDGATELPKTGGSAQDPPTRKIIRTAKGHTIEFEDKDSEELVTITEAAHGNVIMMDQDGITIKTSGTQVKVGTGGVLIGGSGATEALVLGTRFQTQVASFMTALATHTHVGNLGAPTSPPTAPMSLDVPLSTKHKVE
ncbi:phage baseplate assembly protein V [Nonomuraea sp. NPDC050556]|uniref:phage baseplate assembly protein V n=1 Tax=Nonomuraea sp. NPDC050556 TaxID=3364369 RepID=UPI0037B79EA1